MKSTSIPMIQNDIKNLLALLSCRQRTKILMTTQEVLNELTGADSETVIQGFPEIISVNISPAGGVGSTANSLLSRYYRRQAVDSIRRFLITQI
jgi:hypothetical protein